MMNKKKNLLIMTVTLGVLLFTMTLPAFAESPDRGLPYLHIQSSLSDDAFQFNEKGVYVEQTTPPQALQRGWVVLSGNDPLVIKNTNITILLQSQSVLSVVSDKKNDLKFYLVAGSASFLRDTTFLGKMSVNTPVGIYDVMGPGELFVLSDVNELVFSLGSSAQVTNTITRKKSTLSPYHYLDLADPFLTQKQISKQTYETLSINPSVNTSSLLPSASVKDGISITKVDTTTITPESVITKASDTPVKAEVTPDTPVKAEVTPAAPVKAEVTPAAPVKAEVAPAAPVKAEVTPAAPVKAEVTLAAPVTEKIYIIHTNDAFGNISDSAIPYPVFATLLKWNERVNGKALLLDAGNSLTGSDIANMNKGLDVATLYQTLGYDAIAPSTAEYVFGIDHLVEAAKIAKEQQYLDILAANVTDESGAFLFNPYSIYDIDGYRLAVIGLSLPEMNVENVSFNSDEYITLGQKLVDDLSLEADYIIVLGNITPSSGFSAVDIANTIKGIDLIIDGKYGVGKTRVGDTLIVNAGENLTSVGVVELSLLDKTLSSVQALTITKDDIANPENSEIAQAFNITTIPGDPEVASYIASLQKELLAREAEKSTQIEIAKVATPTNQETIVPASATKAIPQKIEPATEQVTNPLEIQPQKEITTSNEIPAPTTEYGLKTTFVATKDNALLNNSVKVGISINPYLHINKGRLGLQAFYLTDGSLFDIEGSDATNLTFGSGTFDTLRSTLRFIDYFYYGEKGDNLFISMDGTTPITFNRGFLINNYSPSSGPYEEKLGLYASLQLGKFGIEGFVDDMYLTDLSEGLNQNGAVRISYDIGSRFNLGLGALVNTDRSLSDITLYPTFDASLLMVNKRTMQLSLFGAASTVFDLIPFSITPMYDASATNFSAKFPNFQVTGGLEIKSNAWNISLIGAAQNVSDPLMGYGALNDTYFSASRIAQDSGIYFLFGGNIGYSSTHFGIDLSYYVPIEQNFSRIIPLDGDSNTTGDNLSFSMNYRSENFTGKIGIRRVGVITSAQEIFNFDDGLTGFLDDSINFFTMANYADPYISAQYSTGPFSIYLDLSFLSDGTNRATIGSTVDIGTKVEKSVSTKETKADAFNFSVDAASSYTRLFNSGSDDNYISLNPVLTISKNNFSVGIGPRITYNADTAELYYHTLTSPFTFGTTASSTLASVYDIVTDSFALLDHLQIGNIESGNYVNIDKDQTYSQTSLIQSMNSSSDTTLQDKLSFVAEIDSKYLDLSLFMNDLINPQLAAISLGISPFATYRGAFGLSGVVSAKLTTSGEKQFDVIPTIDVTLPIFTKETSSIALYGAFSTLLGYDSTDGFSQMFYNSSVPAFTARFNNYMIQAGIHTAFNNFTLDLEASTQEGVLEPGLFNSLFLRERDSIIDAFDEQWTDSTISSGRTYAASANLTYNGDNFDLHASYMLPLTTTFGLIGSEDLLHLGSSVDIKNMNFALDYTRRGFLNAANTFIDSSDSIIDRVLTFVLTDESVASVTMGVTSGNLNLNVSAGTYTNLASDGTYNGVTASTTVPFLSLKANINLF